MATNDIRVPLEQADGSFLEKLIPYPFGGADVSVSASSGNRLVNENFLVDQEFGSASQTLRSDNTYVFDQWVLLHNVSGSDRPTTQRFNSSNTPSGYGRITTATSTSIQLGLCQPIEFLHCGDLRDQTVTFSAKVRTNLTGLVARIAVLQFGGTADAFSTSRDVVGTWANPISNWATNITLAGSQASTTLTSSSSFTSLSATVTLNSSFNNLAVLIYTSPITTSGTTFDVAACQLELGSTASTFQFKKYQDTLSECQRYFRKSYEANTVPGTTTTAGEVRYIATGTGGEAAPYLSYTQALFASPSLTIYSPNTGASGNIRNYSTSADVAATSFILVSKVSHMGISVSHTSGQLYGYHYTASARL